jgi:hypothetical protein
MRYVLDEELKGLCDDKGRIGLDFANLFVRLHDLLDAVQRQLVLISLLHCLLL